MPPLALYEVMWPSSRYPMRRIKMTDMHIPEERFYEVVMEGTPLSESDLGHLSDCQHCIDVFGNMMREIVQKRIEARKTASDRNEPPGM